MTFQEKREAILKVISEVEVIPRNVEKEVAIMVSGFVEGFEAALELIKQTG